MLHLCLFLRSSVQFSSNYAILVPIAATQPLRPAAGDGRVPGHALIYTGTEDPPAAGGEPDLAYDTPTLFFD